MAGAATTSSQVASGPLADLVGAGIAVPLVQGGELAYVNLDYAASAPSLTRVAERVAAVLPWYSSVHRGSGYLSLVSTSLYESARATIHRFVGARPDDVVVFTRNTTDSLNLLARSVPDGGEVVFLDIEHHADLLPWQRRQHRCVRVAATLGETLERLADALDDRPAALVAVTGASNVTGEVVPVREIVELAHARGARVALDAAQLAPHRRIDLARLGADYVAFSGHKCYAPYGTGVLAGRRDWLDEAPAYLAGGGAVERVTVEETIWTSAPQRHEGGTPNLLGAVALAEASLVLAPLFGGEIEAHERALRERLVAGLEDLGGVRELRIWGDSSDAIGVVAFDVVGHDAGLVAAYLACEHGIGVRDGRFCAHPLLERLNAGKGALRASFGLGSSLHDVDRLLGALAEYRRGRSRQTYTARDGVFTPDGDRRPVPFPQVDLGSPTLAPPCKG
ncbi:MAG: aminotransferase class [Acidimicrobiaceae bacterium]|jgi:selenocysteine lyase/cysteine desulfurase|nr:aminotransferase class [Acidimicrobiaceae bacterium]